MLSCFTGVLLRGGGNGRELPKNECRNTSQKKTRIHSKSTHLVRSKINRKKIYKVGCHEFPEHLIHKE